MYVCMYVRHNEQSMIMRHIYATKISFTHTMDPYELKVSREALIKYMEEIICDPILQRVIVCVY